jgi:hypothetical protein
MDAVVAFNCQERGRIVRRLKLSNHILVSLKKSSHSDPEVMAGSHVEKKSHGSFSNSNRLLADF